MSKRSNLDEIELFHEKGLHIPTRTIKFDQDDVEEGGPGVEIGPLAMSRLLKNLHVLTTMSHDPINIIMVSGGGSVIDGIAIFDAIRCNPCHITISVLGQASSMAAIILQAADHRVCYPFSRLMLHDGDDGYIGHPRNFERNAEEGKIYRLRMYEILAARTGKPKAYWARKISFDYYLSAEQALAEKLIDEIIQTQEF